MDHGAYVPLKEMFPDADVPVVHGSGDLHAKTAIEGFWFGLSKRSWTLT